MLQFVADRIRVSLASAIACSGRARAFAAVALSTAALASPTFADNTLVAWGYNWAGQTDVPPTLTGVVQVAAGWYHTAAVKSDDTVVAWGYNDYGQTNVPQDLTGVEQVAAGWLHTVADRKSTRLNSSHT